MRTSVDVLVVERGVMIFRMGWDFLVKEGGGICVRYSLLLEAASADLVKEYLRSRLDSSDGIHERQFTPGGMPRTSWT